ncbi:MAG: hypothetical protein JSS66_06560 [Armatimonadetes bacterium]|nr:hypothetical protein [Armatimonadota bacterium]
MTLWQIAEGAVAAALEAVVPGAERCPVNKVARVYRKAATLLPWSLLKLPGVQKPIKKGTQKRVAYSMSIKGKTVSLRELQDNFHWMCSLAFGALVEKDKRVSANQRWAFDDTCFKFEPEVLVYNRTVATVIPADMSGRAVHLSPRLQKRKAAVIAIEKVRPVTIHLVSTEDKKVVPVWRMMYRVTNVPRVRTQSAVVHRSKPSRIDTAVTELA